MSFLRISTDSDPGAAAGAIANGIRERGIAEVQVIGPRAVNQAVKAIAIARGYVAASGVDLYCTPSFASIIMADSEEERTAIHFVIRPRHKLQSSSSGDPDIGV